jgi:hypothetical protein
VWKLKRKERNEENEENLNAVFTLSFHFSISRTIISLFRLNEIIDVIMEK